MQRGSLFAAILSFAGSILAFAVVAAQREVVSMFTAVGIVLLLNAAVRVRLASATPARDDDHR